MERLDDLLQQFAAYADERNVATFGRGGPIVAIGCLTHGNEPGPLEGAVAVMDALARGALTFPGTAHFIVGNEPAARAGVRFIEADLNRVWVEGATGAEADRARQLMPLLDTVDVFVDLHQTSQPALRPFWTDAWKPELEAWIAALGEPGDPWLTRPPGEMFAPGTCCADEYLQRQGRVGLTLELGERGFRPEVAERVQTTIKKLFAAAAGARRVDGVLLPPGEHPDPSWLVRAHSEPFDDRRKALRPGVSSLQPVQAGELLSEGPIELRAPADGFLAFPFHAPRDAEGLALGPLPQALYQLMVAPPGRPAELWGR